MMSLDRLAPLFAYPDEGYAARAAESARLLGLEPMRAFADAVTAVPAAALQEQFVETFDLDPDCAPDLGWHLFGERYERGEWLARLRADLRRLGLQTSAELPDHLTNVLMILARDEPARADALARLVTPAFDKLQTALERRESPFRHVLTAVQAIVSASSTGAAHV
jgi:nitrate reductase delta subunit